MNTMVAENPRAVVGGNNPPEPTPYELAAQKVNDIYDETVQWLDGHPIDSQELADGVGNLLALIREAEKFADETRIAEKTPLDEKVKEIQARYAPLIGDTKAMKGKTVLAAAACKAALEPWLKKVADEIAAKAAAARKEVEEKQRVAQEALRASDATNLEERARAEALLKDAKAAERVASKAERQTATAGGSMGRATGLRTTYVATITDPIAFGRHAWGHCRDEYQAFLQGLADRLVHGGARALPGVEIKEEKRVA